MYDDQPTQELVSAERTTHRIIRGMVADGASPANLVGPSNVARSIRTEITRRTR